MNILSERMAQTTGSKDPQNNILSCPGSDCSSCCRPLYNLYQDHYRNNIGHDSNKMDTSCLCFRALFRSFEPIAILLHRRDPRPSVQGKRGKVGLPRQEVKEPDPQPRGLSEGSTGRSSSYTIGLPSDSSHPWSDEDLFPSYLLPSNSTTVFSPGPLLWLSRGGVGELPGDRSIGRAHGGEGHGRGSWRWRMGAGCRIPRYHVP